MQMPSPTSPTINTIPARFNGRTEGLSATQYLSLESIGGHILSAVEMPSPAPDQVSVTRWAIRLNGSREGLALGLSDGGVWNIFHIPSGVILFSAAVPSLGALLSAMGRTMSYEANWNAPGIAELNAKAHTSLRALRGYLA